MRNDTLNALIMRHGDRLLHQAGCQGPAIPTRQRHDRTTVSRRLSIFWIAPMMISAHWLIWRKDNLV